MADVRSLLRQERAARQQSSGRPQKQSANPAGAPTSKKRKAADVEADASLKRVRAGGAQTVPMGFFDSGNAEGDDTTPTHVAQANQTHNRGPQDDIELPEAPAAIPEPPQPSLLPEEAAELNAFLKEMEEAPQPPPDVFSRYTDAVIEAAPMTAAEVAAQAREEHSTQRGHREEELEAEKDEAARQLEDEFEEMEGLEERVRKLREKREALRKASAHTATADVVLSDPDPAAYGEQESESENEDEDEDWDDWGFRPA